MSDWDDDNETSDEELEAMTDVPQSAPQPEPGITVTVDARALDNIVEAAALRIERNMRETVAKMVQQRIDAILDQAWKDTVGAIARESIETFLLKPRVRTDSYGSPIYGKETTISELVPQTVERWMDQKVDSEGRPSDYSGSKRRLDHIVHSLVTAQLAAATKSAADQVTEKARAVVANHVARFVAQEMVPAIELAKG